VFVLDKKVKAFLDEVCIYINCKAVHKDIREELLEHINELTKENVNHGYDEKEALDMAICAMGNTEEIGVRLNRQHKPRMEWSILILTVAIAVIGAIVMYTSSQFTSGVTIDFSTYILIAAIGVGTMVAFYYFDYTKLKNLSAALYFSGILLLVATLFIGTSVNGVRRWIPIGPFSVAIPEVASLLFLIAFVGFLEKYRGKGAVHIIKILFTCMISVFLIMLLPSLATAFMLFIVYAAGIITAVIRNHFGGNKKMQYISLLTGGGVAASLLLYRVIANPYLLMRLNIFTEKSQGYQEGIADNWLTLSNWFGKMSYSGESLNMVMPNITGEYILINVIATFGWAVGVALVLLIGAFIIRSFLIASKIKNDYGFYLSFSACMILSAQFLINILMNFNLFPLTAVNMPFVSYGGIEYVVNMAFVGIILSVWRRDNLISHSDVVGLSNSKKEIISFSNGKLIIDLQAWRE